MANKVRYSVVVPVHSEARSLIELADRVEAVFKSMGRSEEFELIFVDDGSTDDTAAILDRLTQERRYMRAITLRRHCGKSLALSAGFRHITGDFMITLDGDLQDAPEDIPHLLAAAEERYDLVVGWRVSRFDSFTRRAGSRLYNWFVQRVSGLRLHDMNCAVKVYRAALVKSLCIYGQYHRYIPLQAHLAGFTIAEMPVSNSPRRFGASRFRTFRYEGFFDLMSVLFLDKYGFSPLHFFGKVGGLLVAPALLAMAYAGYRAVLSSAGPGPSNSYLALLAVSFAALLVGLVMITMGFVCDFLLHHTIRARIDDIIALSVSRIASGEVQAGV
jgi:glycosyltransferase involved in cell wall biosynthesis